MGKHSSNDSEEIEEMKEQKKKAKKEKKAKSESKGRISIVGLLCRIVLLVSSVFLVYELNNTGMIPFKFMVAGIAILAIINIGFLVVLFKNRKNLFVKMISSVIVLAMSAAFIFEALQIRTSNEILSDMGLKYESLKFYVIVRDESKYESLEDLSNKSMGYYKNEMAEGTDAALEKVTGENEKIVAAAYTDIEALGEGLLDKEIDALLIEDSYKQIMIDPDKAEEESNEEETEGQEVAEEDEEDYEEENVIAPVKKKVNDKLKDFDEKTRVIYEFEIQKDVVDIVKNAEVTQDTFNVYISGIDTYGNIASVSRSDVNIVATINPATKQILLTSIPRDYYVQLHGTTGYKDKLTHAGVYGVDKSVKTIEDLLDIDINYYVKFNFSSVIKIVNKLGGVDVYSDYSFTSVKGHYQFQKGFNHVNGKQALAFVRERKAFRDGDRQRGRDQQAMIDAIVNKCLTPSILTKYASLLKELKSTFVTNMPNDKISELVKMQLDTGGSWTISTNNLTGVDSMQYTYSYSGSPLYVMVPYEKSIKTAKELIQKVVDGKKLKKSYEASGGKTVYTPKVVPVEKKKKEDKKDNTVDNKIKENIIDDNSTIDDETNEVDPKPENKTEENQVDPKPENKTEENKVDPTPEPDPEPEPEPDPEPAANSTSVNTSSVSTDI